MEEVNAMLCPKTNINWARKAMIGCGLSKGLGGKWEVDQLFSKLRELVDQNIEHFNQGYIKGFK